MPTAVTPSPGTSTPEANTSVLSPAASVPLVKGAPLIKNVGTCHASASTTYGTSKRDTEPLTSSRHGLGLNVYPARIKKHRHVKREDGVPQRRGIWNGVPHNDQDNCNPLCNINPVEPFGPHSSPFKTAAIRRKKPGPLSGPGLINDGAPWRIRTVDLGIRSPLLYPTELMEQITARPSTRTRAKRL